ncbi:universal stress protein [Ferrovibrio sp.]|uniref:universal stress protein n=1 Tax=Ferrovibrio sp. TaxID=1917215 RepID=UPI00311F23D4
MGFRDLLLHLTCGDDERVADRVGYAAALAAHCGAHLTGLFTRPRMALAYHYIPAAKIAEHRATVDLAAATGRRLFEENLARHGIAGEWLEADAGALEAVQLHGRTADLVVLGQPGATSIDPLVGPEYDAEHLSQDLMFSLGRPVIRLPRDLAPEPRCSHVLIGWNGKKEAARAVHDALPLLCQADKVTVLCVDEGRMDGTPGADLARHLARHDVTVELVVSPESDRDAGAILLEQAARLRADLIVMGAYGYMRWRERVFGGATESVLDGARIPVLFSH